MIKRLTFIGIFLLFHQLVWAQQSASVRGRVLNENGEALSFANIALEGTKYGSYTNENGAFEISKIPAGNYILRVSQVGYQGISRKIFLAESEVQELSFNLIPRVNELAQVEVFGERNKQPEKLATITRLPLAPSEQIQSISVISDRLIREQGALTIADATRNVPGVYTFATYGNKRESMSSRGFRGIPVLKNGVRINSDFRGIGVLTDMVGVETIQVLKGANAITQGLAGDIGSPGGIINIVTKTPRFTRGGYVSMRAGSFNQFRPSFDAFGPLNEKQTIAYRINGAYESADSYRDGISQEKFYINPSFEWRPDKRTTITLEMDYLDDSRTPDLGTVNLAANDINAIYDLPYNVFLGFETDRTTTKNITYAARFNRELNEQLSVRAAFYRSELDVSDVGASLSAGGGRSRLPELDEVSQRYRSLGSSSRLDNNSVLQLDLIGAAVETGHLKHTFQVGVDYRSVFLETANASLADLDYVDIIDVFEPVGNQLPTEIGSLVPGTAVASNTTSFGVMAQDVITLTDWAKTFFGVRYSSIQSSGSATTGVTLSNAWNPLVGLMVSPVKNMNVFGSYTSSTNPGTAARVDVRGESLGNERIDQWEAGVKSDWLNHRLRFNLTLFKINNTNMNMPVYDENWNETGYYTKGGNDERKGLEVELTGRVLKNLELIAGYSYIDAKYKEHASFFFDSAPLNTPKHTANFWANYSVENGLFEGLSFGAGAFYIGERPNNDWARTYTHEGIVPGQKPFDMEAYTNVNLQAAYSVTKHLNVRLLANNIFDEIGYNAYRTRYINQTAPRNYAGVLTYKF
jgi:iron complex outermembrane receptor protein